MATLHTSLVVSWLKRVGVVFGVGVGLSAPLMAAGGSSYAESADFAEAAAAEASGTGGVEVVRSQGGRAAPRSGLPQVTVLANGFILKTSKGEILQVPTGRENLDRFLTLWWDLHNPENSYFSRQDVPYHAPETFIVEAPDYGHLTTSETMSYWVWLEAMYARFTGDYSLLHYAMDITEKYAIPQHQPTVGAYQPTSPATYAREESLPSLYPVPFEQAARAGVDPLSEELKNAYGPSVYGMHWLIDATNWYGFGTGDQPTFINTFQRGVQESVWETVPHPSIEDFRYGSPTSGYLDIFARDPAGYKRQWRYTNAPDADARLVQAVYDAWTYAQARGEERELGTLPAKATKMGDFLRYAMFDKYFKKIGCDSPNCTPGSGFDSAHYLLSWYYAWGGSSPVDAGAWSWRIGCSHAHFGYQNPLAAYALSQKAAFKPVTPTGASMWSKSLDRQIEFYEWLQSPQGAIAGGATNSVMGQYAPHVAGSSSFYGLVYDENPVYHDPGSNTWFGWQAWSMQRVAQYYRESGDARAASLLDRWVAWVYKEVKLTSDGSYTIPSTLRWTGTPGSWSADHKSSNENLSVTVVDTTRDIGITGALAKTLLQYAEASAKFRGDSRHEAKDLAQELLSRMWRTARDAKGMSVAEARGDYKRLHDSVFIPSGYKGTTPDGVTIDQAATFASLRPKYKSDPEFVRTERAIAQGYVPVFHYHRFWAQVEAALAYAEQEASAL